MEQKDIWPACSPHSRSKWQSPGRKPALFAPLRFELDDALKPRFRERRNDFRRRLQKRYGLDRWFEVLFGPAPPNKGVQRPDVDIDGIVQKMNGGKLKPSSMVPVKNPDEIRAAIKAVS